ncbi:hypothetical protein GGI20_002612 [Coemansia sp. BCRC 34301]|nr:hypothetical protein GGI20_002612 [Coemansia sp. BCRC 34301]
MDIRLRQLKRMLADSHDNPSSDAAEQFRYAMPWTEVQLADTSERTVAWSETEKERVFELLKLGLTSPLMIAKYMGKTKSLCQVAEFLEYLSLCSTFIGSSSDDMSEDGDAEDNQEPEYEPESEDAHLEPEATVHILSSSSEQTSESSNSSSSSSDSESDGSNRMSMDVDDGCMSVDSISSRPGSLSGSDTSDSDTTDSSDSSDMSGDPDSAVDSSPGASESGKSSSESDSGSDSDDIEAIQPRDLLIAREEKKSLALAVKVDKATLATNAKLLKLVDKAPKEQIRLYNNHVLFDTDYCDVLFKLIREDDAVTVDHATYSEMQLAVVHFIQTIIKDALARQTITRGRKVHGSNKRRIFESDCIHQALQSAGFSPRRPACKVYDDLLRKYLDEDVYNDDLVTDSEQA